MYHSRFVCSVFVLNDIRIFQSFSDKISFATVVPFDPFLPWIFMGEEIIMSTRLWTSGYDIFSPSQSVVGHMYGRQHQPKFWETVGFILVIN